MQQEWTDTDEGLRRAMWLRSQLNSGMDIPVADRADWPNFLLPGEQLYWCGSYVMWRNHTTATELRRRHAAQWRREDDREFISTIHIFTDSGSLLTLPFTWALIGIYWIIRTLFRLPSRRRTEPSHDPAQSDYNFRVEGILYLTNYRIVDGRLGTELAPSNHYMGPLHLSLAILKSSRLLSPDHLMLQSDLRTVSISAGPVRTPELHVYIEFLRSGQRNPFFRIPVGFCEKARMAGKPIPPGIDITVEY